MIILVANIGSTSFKYRLLEMPEVNVLAQGRVERIVEGRDVRMLANPGQVQHGSLPRLRRGHRPLPERDRG